MVMKKIDISAIEKNFHQTGNTLKSLLKISLDLFGARQTGILYGTNHTKLKFLPTTLWDRGIMDRFDARGLNGLILKLLGPYLVTLRKLSPIFFYKPGPSGHPEKTDGIIAYILRNYADYYTKGIRMIICPDTGKKTWNKNNQEEFIFIPFYIFDGHSILPSEDRIRFNARIIDYFHSENSMYIYLPDYGILVINTADKSLLEMKNGKFSNEDELIMRLNVLIRLVQDSSLVYLGRLKGKKRAELLWRKEMHLRQASKELVENEARYRDLYENAPIAYFSMDPQGSILQCNRKAEILCGYDANELIGKNAADLFSGTDGFKGHMKDVLKSLSAGQIVRNMQVMIISGSGDIFPVSLSIEPVTDYSGKILELRVMVLDISRRVMLEKQLRQTQKMEAVGTLAGGIVHDFNNVLSPISGYTELLLMETKSNDPAKKSLEMILDCVTHAKQILSRILTFSRQKTHEPEMLRLADVVKDSIPLVRAFLPSTINLNVSLNEGQELILADPGDIRQIIMNLCANAYHSMKDKGGRIDIIVQSGRNMPVLNQKKDILIRDCTCLSIYDTGVGMDPGLADKIFNPYFSANSQGEFPEIGLCAVHGIVEAHGGHIHVETSPDAGTRFDIYFPVVETCKEPGQETLSERHIEKGTERVLLVDDDKKVAFMETHLMEKLGYTVTCFIDGAEAFENFRNNPGLFDVVITDMNMPQMTGIELAQKIYNIRPDIPVIICTGLGDALDHRKLSLPPVKGFLKKPVSVADLSFTLRQVLAQSDSGPDTCDDTGE